MSNLVAHPETTSSGICSTTDYEQFGSITSNREVDQAHVRKLMAKIQKNNLLHIRPIDVTPDMQVIDGQHRLEAARQLGVSIYYQITQQLSKADIAELNSASKNWTALDYLNYWAVEGVEGYKVLSRFLKNYPQISISAAQLLVSGQDSRSTNDFRSGLYQAYSYEQAALVAEGLNQIRSQFLFKFTYDAKFIAALSKASRTDGFKWAVLMDKISLQPRTLMRCPSQRGYTELLEELYNYKTYSENRLRFR